MDKLQRIEEMQRQLDALKAEVEAEAKPRQWEPEGGCFSISSVGRVCNLSRSHKDDRMFGTERKTREAAEKAATAMRTHNRLLAYVAEFAPDYYFAFGTGSWYVYKAVGGSFGVASDCNTMDIGKVYMPRRVAEELCVKLNSGEVVL